MATFPTAKRHKILCPCREISAARAQYNIGMSAVGSVVEFAAYVLNIGSLTYNGSAPSDPLQNHGFGKNGEWLVSFIPPQ